MLTFQVLHGEQYIKVVKPMPAAGTLTNVYKVQDVLDKGRGMLLLVEIETRNEDGDLLLVNQSSIFVVGAGGFGGSRSSEHSIEVRKPPSRSPDATTSYKTNKDQAALYRMTGDLNRGQRDSSKSMFFTSKNLQFFGLHLNSYTQLIFAPLLDIFGFSLRHRPEPPPYLPGVRSDGRFLDSDPARSLLLRHRRQAGDGHLR